MKAKLKKRWGISIVRGTISDTHFSIAGDIIPTVREQPVKSLCQLYTYPLIDGHRRVKVQRTALQGLHAIERSEIPRKLKAWSFQHGLLPSLLWPLQTYDIYLSQLRISSSTSTNTLASDWVRHPGSQQLASILQLECSSPPFRQSLKN